jgi:hypothetical protein
MNSVMGYGQVDTIDKPHYRNGDSGDIIASKGQRDYNIFCEVIIHIE